MAAGDPIVLSSWRELPPPQRLLTHCGSGLRARGKGKRAQKMGCTWPVLWPHLWLCESLLWARDLRAPFSLWWTLYHYSPSLSHLYQSHSLPQLPGKVREGFLGAYSHTDQGLDWMWFLRDRPGNQKKTGLRVCGTAIFRELTDYTGSRASSRTLRRGLGGRGCCEVTSITDACGRFHLFMPKYTYSQFNLVRTLWVFRFED